MGYVYLVRNPSSNELSVCAHDASLSRGTAVIAPSRYGLDYGLVVGSAIPGSCYCPGSTEVCGACLQATKPEYVDDPDADLVAAADPLPDPDLEQTDAHSDEDLVPSVDLEKDDPSSFGSNEQPQYGSKDSDPVASEGADDGVADAMPPVDPMNRMVELQGEVDWIVRIATEDDRRRFAEYVAMEDDALRLCREKILRHRLDMKLVTAHYLFGEPKIIFFFTAASRVDFRDLVKDLVSVFRMRIELRQIGVRDESRVLGGLAVCGRDFCCHCITDKLDPVSIKMAKEQNLSLNSTKISGPCGRLLCCLSYEYDFYCEEKQTLPSEGSRLKVHKDLMKITEVNILSRKISLSGPEGRFIVIPFSAVRYNEDSAHWEIAKEYLDEFLPS